MNFRAVLESLEKESLLDRQDNFLSEHWPVCVIHEIIQLLIRSLRRGNHLARASASL